MDTQLSKRISSFIWRYGVFLAMAIAAYTANIGDIQEISFNKIATIFVTVTSAYIINEGTKWLSINKQPN